MKILVQTPISRPYDEVFKGFNQKLFEALKPPLLNLKVERFDGCNKGDEVHLLVSNKRWVSHITDFYKDESLEDVFAAIGLEETDLLNEAVRFYPKVVAALDEQGVLEPVITLILTPFYESPQTLANIEKHL